SFGNVVHMDTFYADPRLTQQMISVRSSYFSADNPYTTTGVQVAGFGKPGMLVEMDAIAGLDDEQERRPWRFCLGTAWRVRGSAGGFGGRGASAPGPPRPRYGPK